MRIDGPQITGSFNLNGGTVGDLQVFVTTSSLNNLTASVATTGSNTFVGTQTLSGSIIPAVNNTYDLGSPTNQFRHVYISSGSLYVNGTKVLGSTSQELQITTDAGQSFKILEAGSDTITLQSADGNITLAASGGGDVILDPTTGVIGLKGTVTIYTGNKITSSDGNSIQFGNGIAVTGSIVSTVTPLISGSGQISGLGFATTGSNTFNGNLTVTGYIDTQELRTTYISSSILYRSGSTKFGDDLLDTHAFTGSLLVSGSISVPGSGLVSGSSQVSYTGLTNVPSGLVSGSSQVLAGTTIHSGSFFNGISVVSGSAQIDVMSTTNIARLATTGSNTFSGDIIVQGNDSSAIKLFKLYSGSPAHVGFTIQDRTGANTFYHNANGGGTGINGSLTITGDTIASGSAFTLFGGTSTSDTVSSNITAANGAAAELVIRGGNGTTNRRAAIRLYSNQISTSTAQWVLGASMSQSSNDSNFYLYSSGGTSTITTTQLNYVGINRTDPGFYLDVYANTANTFYTIAQFENRDYTSGTRTFIRVRNWLTAGGSYSSYFGQGQDGKTYIISNNSARGGDIVIDGGNGNVGIADSSPSQKLTVAGSIKMNQDAALRAGADDNWIIGQDSGTNVIHIGSASVANDVRFDSSNQAGNVIIKSNGRLGVNTTDPATTFDVNGYMGLRSNNYFYFGHTTSNIGGWTTRMYANGSTHTFNANGFTFNNEGYGTSTWLNINSSGKIGIGTGGQTARLDIKAAGDEDLIVGRYSGGSAKLFYVYQSSADGYLELRTGADTTITKLSGYSGTPAYMNTKLTVGGTGNYSATTLSSEGPVKVNRKIFGWYQATMTDGYSYWHMKTNMWAGGSPSGNIDYTMSLFYAEFYSYSAYIRSGYLGFHNWSGSFYNVVTTGNVWSSPYTSSDGYTVLVIALGSGSYNGLNIDWNQTYGYPYRDRVVTAATASNSATGVY